MQSTTRLPRRRIQLLVAAVLGALVATVGTGTAARAETVAPELTALSVTPTSVTPPGEVEVHYTASAEVTTLGYVKVNFYSPAYSRSWVLTTQPGAPLDGTLRWSIPDGLRNTTYQLDTVEVMSADGTASTVYHRNGSTSRWGTHDFDFPSKDVTLSGSHEDFDGPTLSSVDVLTPAVKPGQPVTIAWAAQDAHGWKSASFTFYGGADRPSTMVLSTTSAAELAAGKLTRTAPATLYNAKHTLAVVVLEDSLGNKRTYNADGNTFNTPWGDGMATATTHDLPFASWGFTVSGSTFDVLPPKLLSISVDKNTIRTSGTIKVTYATQDDTATLQQVLLRYTRPEVSWDVALGESTLPLSGSFTSSLSEGGWPGQLTLKSVEVRDVRGNDAYYWPDGTIRTSGDRITGRHTLDLSHLDVTVVPDKPSLVARSRPQSAEVSWSVGDYEAKGLTGYEVTVNPGGRVIAVPSDKTGYQSIVVTGLTNATKYTFTVRSLSAAGPGPIASATATPLLSGNVFSAGDVNNDRRPDLVAHLPDGPVRVYRGTGPATFGAGKTVVDVGDQRLFPNARLDGRATFLSLSSGTNLQAIHLAWNVTYVGATPIGSGWGMRFIDGSADFTGDGKADIVAVTSGGTANLYRGNGEAGYSHGTRIATGWSTMQTVFASTDVTGDRKADLLGVDKDGVLWIFPGTGKGTFSPKRKVGSGWGGLGALFHAGDVSADGRNDLGAVTMDGTLRVYKGRANGTFSSAVSVSKGWQAYL